MTHLLLKFSSNYADEFDVEGFAVMTADDDEDLDDEEEREETCYSRIY